jgi:hypothetical protein
MDVLEPHTEGGIESRDWGVNMAAAVKCAHPACQCMVEPKGPHGKYCSDHCRQAGDKTELRCDCQHPPCR